MGGKKSGYRSGGESTLQFNDLVNDEEVGFCKMLLKGKNEIGLCGEKNRKKAFHYCSDCWSIISSEHGSAETKIWPPKRDNFDSRYCFDVNTQNVFLVPKHWMDSYTEIPTISTGPAIEIKYRKHHSKRGGDYPCWVYAIRLEDGMIYIGQTKDLERRLHEHRNKPGKTIVKYGGYQQKLQDVKVNNRDTAEALEQFLVELLKNCGSRATQGYEEDD